MKFQKELQKLYKIINDYELCVDMRDIAYHEDGPCDICNEKVTRAKKKLIKKIGKVRGMIVECQMS